MSKYDWTYCGVCDVMTVVCPACNNACCNGHSNGCCSPAYAYQRRSYNLGNVPDKPQNYEKIKSQVNNMFK